MVHSDHSMACTPSPARIDANGKAARQGRFTRTPKPRKRNRSWRMFAVAAVTAFMVGEPLLGLALHTYIVPIDVYLVIVLVGYVSVALSVLGKPPVYSDAGKSMEQAQDDDDPFYDDGPFGDGTFGGRSLIIGPTDACYWGDLAADDFDMD